MGMVKIFRQCGGSVIQEIRENKLKYVFILVIFGMVVMMASVGFWEYANSPAFCTGCHDMEGYAKAIQDSPHAEVPCVDCHLPPGFVNHLKFKMVDGLLSGVFFLTGKMPSKANAHVSEDNCKRCHEQKIMTMEPGTFKGLPFDHKKHLKKLPLGGFELQCTTCHRQTTEEVHVDVSKEGCMECHHRMKDSKRCTACHEPEEVDVAGNTWDHKRGVGHCKSCHSSIEPPYDPVYNCIRCHGSKAILDSAKNEERMHEIHVNDKNIHFKVECFECHGLAMPEASAGRVVRKFAFMHNFHITKQGFDCLDCHTGDKKPECTNCH